MSKKERKKKRHHTHWGSQFQRFILNRSRSNGTNGRTIERQERQTNKQREELQKKKKKRMTTDRQAEGSNDFWIHLTWCALQNVCWVLSAANASFANERTNQHISNETVPFPTNFSTRVLVGCVNSVLNYAHSPHKLSFSYTSAFFTLHFNELWFQEWSRYRCMLSISWLHFTRSVCMDSNAEQHKDWKCHANSWAAETIYSFAWNLSAMSWVIKNDSNMCASESLWWIFPEPRAQRKANTSACAQALRQNLRWAPWTLCYLLFIFIFVVVLFPFAHTLYI